MISRRKFNKVLVGSVAVSFVGCADKSGIASPDASKKILFKNFKINRLLKELTLEEKASLCSGGDFWHSKTIERLNIPSIMLSDGPHGLRKQGTDNDHLGLADSVKATCFPTASATASSWDKDLLYKMGEALAEECLQEGVDVLLGPGVNIKRSPLCGRNFEFISEDPYLSGVMGSYYVNGVQSKGIGTSLKHFAMNNQEYRRMVIDSVADERTKRELYFAPFEAVVKNSQPWTVMCSYNKLEGVYASDNKKLLTTMLRDEWGHKGLVVTDWGACNDRIKGIQAGLELEMPSSGGQNDAKIVAAVKDGTLSSADLDKAVTRILELIFKAAKNRQADFKYDVDVHHKLAAQLAEESAVLLKNSDNILPLSTQKEVLIIGEFAEKPRFQGSGSSKINPTKVTSTLDALNDANIKYKYLKGYSVDTKDTILEYIDEAVSAAKQYKEVIIFAGLTADYESEGFDRKHLNLPDSHTQLISAVAAVNPNAIIVLQNGSAITMPWIDNVKAVLECYLGGQAGGIAAVNILFGKSNPSGKLAETFPYAQEDDFASKWFATGMQTAEYRESIYVGYRYYDAAKKDVLFPFGYGLSYTEFAYSNIMINKNTISDSEELLVTCDIKNIGSRKGSEIVQLYVKDDLSTIFRPEKELKGFAKISLEAGEKKTVSFVLDKRSFAYYNVELNDWHIESGAFIIKIGASSRDIKLSSSVIVNSKTVAPTPRMKPQDIPEYYKMQETQTISDASFRNLLGMEIPAATRVGGEKFTLNSTLGDVSITEHGKKLYQKTLHFFLGSQENVSDQTVQLMEVMVSELPLRGLTLFSGGKFTFKQVETELAIINSQL